MFVNALIIENFKRIQRTRVPLSPITVVVGGNNSGKSCVLQAPHFAVNLLQATVIETDDTIPAQNLRYLPTGDVLDVPHGERLTNETPPIKIIFELRDDPEDDDTWNFEVKLKRGEGLNVHIEYSTDDQVETKISNALEPYSIYVPGLAGIPLYEEFRSDALIVSAIARGDANLYLRNVLLRIYQDGEKLRILNEYLRKLIDSAELIVQFDKSSDSHIKAWVRQEGRDTPIDAMGTGVLQYLQIVAYVIQYHPAVILLDEPDAHLHPNNQRRIASLLCDVVSDGGTQIVLATHSRTLIDAFRNVDGASFVWMESGSVQDQAKQEHITMLMELGALDGGERFYSDKCSAIFLTEDTKHEYIKEFLLSNGVNLDQTMIHSYKSSSRLQAAIELAKFIKTIKPGVRVILHRDRDFMSDEDITKVSEVMFKGAADVDFFVTEGSDIEHYFTRPEHIAASFEISEEEANELIQEAIEAAKVDLAIKYNNKIDDLKWLYKSWDSEPKKVKSVIKNGPTNRDHCVGKILVGKIYEIAQNKKVNNPKKRLVQPGDTLRDEGLIEIVRKIPELKTKEAEDA